jgi:hypothetical protein
MKLTQYYEKFLLELNGLHCSVTKTKNDFGVDFLVGIPYAERQLSKKELIELSLLLNNLVIKLNELEGEKDEQ